MQEVNKAFTKLDKDLAKTSKSVARFGRDMSKVGLTLTKTLTPALLAVGAAAYKGVQAASDLAETTSKVGEIFGDSASKINDWSNNAALAFGQSKVQAMDAAATFATFGKSAGLAGDNLVDFSTQFVQLASDLASFNNTTPEEAITAIGAAMRGESEPMRRYGVLLDDATMRQKALEMGITSSVKNALTPQQKVLAASALIMEQTADAQGDFARTSDGLANQTRILKAQVTDMSASFGEIFLPIILKVVSVISGQVVPFVQKMIDGFKALSPVSQKIILIMGGLLGSIGPLMVAFGGLITVFAALISPIGLVIAAVVGLTAAGIALYENWDSISYGIRQSISRLVEKFLSFADTWLTGLESITKVFPKFSAAVGNARKVIEELAEKERDSMEIRKLEHEVTKLQEAEEKRLAKAKKQSTEMTHQYIDALAQSVDIKQAEGDETEKLRKKEEELARAKMDFEDQWGAKFRQSTMERKQLLEWEYTEAINQTETLGADTTDIEAYYAAERAKIAKEEADKKIEDAKRERDARKSFADDIISFAYESTMAVAALVDQGFQNKISKIDIELEKQKSAAEATIENEDELKQKIQALEEKAEKKKRALLRKQFRIDKIAAILSTGVQTAVAAMKTFAQLGWPAGLIGAAVVSGIGATQAALIGAQPNPYEMGGIVPGDSYTGDNVPARVNSGEMILNRQQQARLFELANGANRRGGDIHIHAGTIVAGEFSVKEFARRIRKELTFENQRLGIA